MEAFGPPGSSCAGRLNFSPKIFHPPTFLTLVLTTQVRGVGTILHGHS